MKQTDDRLKKCHDGVEDKIIDCSNSKTDENEKNQQEYFVPWHLPFHRAEIGAASAALENGFAKKDEKKGTVVYNRYYHVFVEGELQRWSILTQQVYIHTKKLTSFPFCFYLYTCIKSNSTFDQ
jgi:alkylated DNA repair protein alkB family protein 8